MTVEQILELARSLSPAEQQQLFESLQALRFSKERVPPNQRYSSLLSLAGSAHSDHRDVSKNKMRHLGEVYTQQ